MTVEQTAALRLHDFEALLSQFNNPKLKDLMKEHVNRMFNLLVKERLETVEAMSAVQHKIAV